MKVEIQRSNGDGWIINIDAEEIRGVHWDDRSGGVHKRQKGYSLYGFIDYSKYKDKIKCSGIHDDGYNEMKIKILPAKKRSEYFEGYQMFLSKAGEKPTDKKKTYGMPCTRRILQELADGVKLRGELRSKLTSEGYPVATIRYAIKTMINDKRIITEGSYNSPKQVIKKSETI